MADYEKIFIYMHKGHRLSILYKAYKQDGKYLGGSYEPTGKKTNEYFKKLSEDEYQEIWDGIDAFSKKFNFPF